MSQGSLNLQKENGVAEITFDRPDARNAMTKKMYGDLERICKELRQDTSIRLAILRGAGGTAFVAGSDVGIFSDFKEGEDGLHYEAEMEAHTRALASLPFPVIAVIEGWAVGGGLNLAAACDIRIATPDARFSVPIARTVGNCLSIYNYARLVSEFGPGRAKRMLILGDFLSAEEALSAGFLAEIVDPASLDSRIEKLRERILANAPITMRVSKQAIARTLDVEALTEAEDLIREAYGSEDFKRGVTGFRAKKPPQWQGS